MPTTADYLNDLVTQKDSLAKTLSDNGVEVGENETFSTLVPKANEKIASGVDVVAARVDGTEIKYINNNIETIPAYAFQGCSGLTKVECQNVVSCDGMYTFAGCESLTSISLPNMTTLGSSSGEAIYTFSGCTSLEVVSMPNLESITERTNVGYIFKNCSSLRIANFLKLKRVPYRMFDNCYALEEIYMPEATAASNWAFAYCTVPMLSLPKMETFGADNTFANSGIQIIELPSILLIKNNKTFLNCKQLHTLTLGTSRDSTLEMYIDTTTFQGCTSLQSLTVNCTLKRYGGTNLSLTLESAKSVIESLYNYSGTSEDLAYSLSFSTFTLGLLEAEGATAPGDITWIDYANRKGWNI